MFRLKLVLTFVISVLAVMVVALASQQGTLGDAIEQDTEESLRRAATISEQQRRIVEGALVAKAEFVAGGPDLYDAITKKYTKPAANEGEEPVFDAKHDLGQRHLATHERLDRYQKEFQLYLDKAGKGINQLDLPLQWQRPQKPDLFFAVDAKGIGLAALGKDLYKWHDVDVSGEYNIIGEVMTKREVRTSVIKWSYDPNVKPENKSTYLVAFAPIMKARDLDPVGVVAIGSLLNDGSAKATRDYIAGTAGAGVDDAEKARVFESAPHMALMYDSKIVGSTFDTNMQKEVAAALGAEGALEAKGAEKVGQIVLDEDTYLVRSRVMPGQRGAEKPAEIVVLANLTHAKAPLDTPMSNIILVAIVLALLGSVLILVFVQLYLKPIADVESGIQEVIAGNKDYLFDYRGSNKTAASLAQQLNLMSAFLQGKPMPDDDNPGGGWGELNGGGGGQRSGPAQVQGVSMADLMGAKPKKSDHNEG